MAKIILKNYEELILPDEKAVEIREQIEARRKEIETTGLGLNMFPLVVETISGIWSGTMADVSQISDSSKTNKRIGFFSSVDGVKEFHKKYGYGGNKSEYIQGYGSMDVKTKFLIKINKAKLVDSFGKKSLVVIEWKDKEKAKRWSDLWEIYELNLDAFDDLVSDDKIVCR